ncbi:uncharacterized protein LOC143468698 [Clavelina lepadiformis]|uniref:uncharacterized protein LOC143468698 n=1 Tax=Clavelina lepadiformis TaxID=159417 RepID=UPI0040435A05
MDIADVKFYPFCYTVFADNPLLVALKCLDCDYVNTTKTYASVTNGTEIKVCNPDVKGYPLPLYKCEVCDGGLLIAALVYIAAVSLITTLFNLWTFVVWLNVKRKRPQIYFKLSLAFSDFLFGALVLPEAAYHLVNTMFIGHEEYYAFYKLTDLSYYEYDYRRAWEVFFYPSHIKFSATMLYVSQGASLCSIFLLCLDRHIAVSYSLKYNRIMTKAKSLLFIGTVWMVMILLGLTTTFLTKTFSVKPYGFFLPFGETYEHEQSLSTALVFLAPLCLLFAATVWVTGYTSYNISRAGNGATKGYGRSRKSTSVSLASIASVLKKDVYFQRDVILSQSIGDQQDSSTKDWEDSKNHNSQENDFLEQNACKEKIFPTFERKTTSKLSESTDIRDDWPTKARKMTAKNSKASVVSTLTTVNNEHKAANRTLLLILVIYSITILPVSALVAAYIFDENLRHKHGAISLFESASSGFVVTIGIFMTSSLWNCVIYSLRNREYRATTKLLFRKIISTFLRK